MINKKIFKNFANIILWLYSQVSEVEYQNLGLLKYPQIEIYRFELY